MDHFSILISVGTVNSLTWAGTAGHSDALLSRTSAGVMRPVPSRIVRISVVSYCRVSPKFWARVLPDAKAPATQQERPHSPRAYASGLLPKITAERTINRANRPLIL